MALRELDSPEEEKIRDGCVDLAPPFARHATEDNVFVDTRAEKNS